ncbi:DUF6082 family protein [Streptomyces sp. NPDC058084]|uniref:DUF6082 family protein n=1 Tax=Streptomyces sp. NPDC058084 TaxID=3346333 RepID=UPI0036EFD668
MSILFALLLAAVVAVLLMYVAQRREHHRDSVRATVLRAQVELLKAAAESPEAARLTVGGRLPADAEPGEVRRHLFLDAQLTAWELQWRIGALSERQLRAHAQALLADEEGRRYWDRARAGRTAVEGEDSKLRAFNGLFDAARPAAAPAGH